MGNDQKGEGLQKIGVGMMKGGLGMMGCGCALMILLPIVIIVIFILS